MTKSKASRRVAQGQRGIPGPPGPAGPAGDTGAQGIKGSKGETGSQGTAGNNGLKGETGSQGVGGPRGHDGRMGPEGAVGPAGRATNFGDLVKQVAYVDRSIEHIYNEMGTHIARMTQLQKDLDILREKVRELATRAGKGTPLAATKAGA